MSLPRSASLPRPGPARPGPARLPRSSPAATPCSCCHTKYGGGAPRGRLAGRRRPRRRGSVPSGQRGHPSGGRACALASKNRVWARRSYRPSILPGPVRWVARVAPVAPVMRVVRVGRQCKRPAAAVAVPCVRCAPRPHRSPSAIQSMADGTWRLTRDASRALARAAPARAPAPAPSPAPSPAPAPPPAPAVACVRARPVSHQGHSVPALYEMRLQRHGSPQLRY